MTAKGYGVSFQGDGNILKLTVGMGDVCVNVLKPATLCTLFYFTYLF